jgi:2-polyprenyl-6-methoxyphenol hydroxylase-like FAD-dependent oxidoreductase
MTGRDLPRGRQRVVVIGAGVVGIACALTLRRDGHDVVVLDPRSPPPPAHRHGHLPVTEPTVIAVCYVLRGRALHCRQDQEK